MPKPLSLSFRLFMYAGILLAMLALGLVIVVPMTVSMQVLLAAVAIGLMLILKRFKSRAVTIALVFVSVTISTRYLYWRTTETLYFNNGLEAALGIGLYLAELYAWLILVLGYIQSIWPLPRGVHPLPDDPSTWPTVDVYIPTYNESLSVVQDTILAAQNLDYPDDKFNIYVLDDGRRPEFGAFAAAAGVGYIIRPDNNHAKAGNLNHAMGKTRGELICIFDCDHITTRAFLKATVGAFIADPHLALMQTPHHFYSPDPFERNLATGDRVPNEGELFYGPVQQGNDFWNAAFFCGSCAVIRRTALQDTNGFAVETVTEDAHTALKLQRKGWNTAFLAIPLAAGLATERLALHVGQRMRWARGMTQIFRRDNPLLGRGLTLPQRLCYLNAMMHFQFALPRIVFLTAPLAFLLLGQNIIAASAAAVFAYALPHLILSVNVNARIQGRHRYSYWGEIYETTLAFHILFPTLVTLIDPKRGKFNVTDKGGLLDKGFFDSHIVRPQIITACLLVAGLVFGVMKYFWFESIKPDPYVLLMNVLWTAFSLLILLGAIATAREKAQMRHSMRIDVDFPASLMLENGYVLQARVENISMGGAYLELKTDYPELDKVEDIEIHNGNRSTVFNVDIVNVGKNRSVRVRFRNLGIEQRRELVRIIMGRPDAWLKDTSKRMDRPLRSLGLVAQSALKPLFQRKPKEQPGSRPSALGLLLATALGLGAWLPSDSFAQTPPAPLDFPSLPPPVELDIPNLLPMAPPSVDASQQEQTIAFKQIGITSPLRIRGQRGEVAIPFSINQQHIVTAGKLNLMFSYSDAMLPDRSYLEILLNNELVETILLSGRNHKDVTVEVPFNPLYLLPYNRINLRLRGHYSDVCENPLHPSLWAEVSEQSSIQLSLQRLPFSQELANLPGPFFDEADLSPLSLSIVLPEQPDEQLLQVAATLASWFGARADFRGARFPVLINELPAQGHAIVFARNGEEPPGLEMSAPGGASLSLQNNPNDAFSQLLLVQGADNQELQAAVMNLMFNGEALAGNTANGLQAIRQEPRQPFDAPRWIPSRSKTLFSSLDGGNDLTSDNLFAGSMNLNFRAAPDTFLWQGKNIPLHLGYRFPEGDWFDAAHSRLDVALNGQYLTSTPVLQPGVIARVKNWFGIQNRLEQARIELPPSLIYGENQLSFYFNLNFSNTEDCGLVLPDNGLSVISPESSIDLSAAQHFTQLPNLSFFVGAGFPYTRLADLSETAFVLPETPLASEIETLFNLAGRMGDATGYPITRATVQFGLNSLGRLANKDILVVSELNRNRLDLAPLIGQSLFQQEDRRLRVKSLDTLGQIKSTLLGDWGREYAAADRTLSSRKTFKGLFSLPSPLGDKRVVVLLTASSASDLPGLVSQMRTPAASASINGDLAVFERNDSITSHRVGPRFAYGELPWNMYVRWLFSERPIPLMLILFGASILAAACAYPLLRQRAQSRLSQQRP